MHLLTLSPNFLDAAFNILLNEDLALGSAHTWLMDEHDRVICKCENQFIDSRCQDYAIKSLKELQETPPHEQKANLWYCQRTI